MRSTILFPGSLDCIRWHYSDKFNRGEEKYKQELEKWRVLVEKYNSLKDSPKELKKFLKENKGGMDHAKDFASFLESQEYMLSHLDMIEVDWESDLIQALENLRIGCPKCHEGFHEFIGNCMDNPSRDHQIHNVECNKCGHKFSVIFYYYWC